MKMRALFALTVGILGYGVAYADQSQTVYFDNVNLVISSKYSSSVTEGTVTNVITSYDLKANKTKMTITTSANRKASTSTVNWMKNTLYQNGIPWSWAYMLAISSDSMTPPNELNLAISFGMVTLIKGETGSPLICNNFAIGQGSSGAHNNWWIFNNNTAQTNRTALDSELEIRCYNNGAAYSIGISTKSPNEFSIDN